MTRYHLTAAAIVAVAYAIAAWALAGWPSVWAFAVEAFPCAS